MPTRTAFALVLALLAATAFALPLEVAPAGPTDARTAALGGKHVALADDFSVLLANPAGLAAAKPEFFAAQLGLRVSGPVFDIAQGLLDGKDPVTLLQDLLGASANGLYAGTEIGGPVAFGFVGEGLGFGLYNTTRIILDARNVTSLKLAAGEELLLAGGYAFRVDLGGLHSLDLGLVAKGMVRGEMIVDTTILDVMNIVSNPMGQPFRLVTGIGLDAGLRWSWDDTFSAGIAVRDAYSPSLATSYSDVVSFATDPAAAKTGSESALVPPDLAVGFAWTPRISGLADALSIAVDYSDILDLFATIPRNAILKLSIGAELRVLDILYIRAGISETLPSAGVGVDLGVFRLNATAWGDELGIEPGARAVYNLLLSLEFRY